MFHRLYHTAAILLGSRSYGEANRLLFLLTADLGLVTVAAQGVRQQHSKLRPQLINYSLLTVTLVRGRDIWRLTGAEQVLTPALRPAAAATWLRLCHLARRLIQGEVAESALFDALKRWRQELATSSTRSAGRLAELWYHLELLQLLGYVPAAAVIDWRREVSESQLVRLINQALTHSQL